VNQLVANCITGGDSLPDNLLLRFLNKGLINVGGDDAKFEKLQATASQLAEDIRKTPACANSFALTAFDPEIPENDPAVRHAISVLEVQWPTYVNTFAGTPLTVIRAVLFDALVQAARVDENVAVAFVTSARNVLPTMQVGGERSIWTEVLTELEREVDSKAEAEWATPSTIAVADVKLTAPPTVTLKLSQKEVNRETLQREILAASGPTGGSHNPHWPNQPQPWVNEFSPRLANAVAAAIEGARSDGGAIDLSKSFAQITEGVAAQLRATLNAISTATAGLQRRTHLIWWKQALYSATAHVSYRELPVAPAATLMAFDLFKQLPTFSPISVSAFLREAVVSISEKPDDKIALGDLVEITRTDGKLAELREATAQLVPVPNGRCLIISLIGHPEYGPITDRLVFRNLVGVQRDYLLTPPDWAVWIFRELQAARAVRADQTAKPKARKVQAE
jgi:hypothetical protein